MKTKIHLTVDDGWRTKSYNLIITEEQGKLLNWLDDNVFDDTVDWEVIDEEENVDLTEGFGD